MAENPQKPRSKHDGVSNLTNGAVNAETAASVADMAGMLPGGFGAAATATGVVFHTEASSGATKEGIDYLADRMGLTAEQLRADSPMLDDDDKQYRNGSALGRRGGQAALQAGGALAGGYAGSFIPIPVVGTIIGGYAGSMAGSAVGSFIIPEKHQGMSDTQFMCELCGKQDDGSLSAEDIVRLVGRKTNSQSQRDYIESQMTAKNTTGFGLTTIAQQHLGPLLTNEVNPAESHDPGRETEFEYIARLCREGKLDVAQLARKTEMMEMMPPRRAQQPAEDSQVAMDYADVDEATPPSARLPGKGPKGRRERDTAVT